jgi:hypothetical protein
VNQPANPPGPPPAGPPPKRPQSPLSEAVEQAGDTAQHWLHDLQHFAESEADTLAAGRYGLTNLAIAPVRLFEILVSNAITTTSTVTDNLALLSLSGRFGTATARRAFRVYVGKGFPPAVGLRTSDLVGSSTNYHIPSNRIGFDRKDVTDDGTVTIIVYCSAAPPDTYVGTLTSDDPLQTISRGIQVAIDEIGDPVT